MNAPEGAAQAPHELDIDAARKQAIGSSYVRPKNLADRLAEYRSGVLKLPPHPKWTEADPTDWTADPFTDRNWQFQFHSLKWLTPLRWAALEGDSSARSEWLRVARSWFDSNVPPDRSQAAFAWRDMTDGNRAIHLSLGAPLAGPEDQWYVDLLGAHRDWLMDPDHIVPRNHGLHQHAGLFVVASVLRDTQAMETAAKRMTDQFLTAFDAQGTNDEGSINYHQMNMRWWIQSWDRVRLGGYPVPDRVERRLTAASEVLAHLSHPNGQIPQVGDSASGPVLKNLGSHAEFARTRGAQGTSPASEVRVLDGGYICSRSGWGDSRDIEDESHMVIRHGADLAAHSHQDRGSLVIYSAGRPWLVDGGFYSYQPRDPIRTYLHSRDAHNLATLVDRAHDDSIPVELTRSDVTSEHHDFELVDRGYGDAVLHRRVVYLTGPDCWLVWDRAVGAGATPLVQSWLVDTGISARRHDKGYVLSASDAHLGMTWLGPAVPRLRRTRAVDGSFEGWIGEKWKTLKKGTRIVAQTHKPERGLLVLLHPGRSSPIGIAESYVTGDRTAALTLLRGGDEWRITIDESVVIEKKS